MTCQTTQSVSRATRLALHLKVGRRAIQNGRSKAIGPHRRKLTVLRQSGRATYALILKHDTNLKDGFVEIKFKAIAGSEDRAAGIVWRAKDTNNYYVVRANTLEENVVLYKTAKGVRSPKSHRYSRPKGWLWRERGGAFEHLHVAD